MLKNITRVIARSLEIEVEQAKDVCNCCWATVKSVRPLPVVGFGYPMFSYKV